MSTGRNTPTGYTADDERSSAAVQIRNPYRAQRQFDELGGVESSATSTPTSRRGSDAEHGGVSSPTSSPRKRRLVFSLNPNQGERSIRSLSQTPTRNQPEGGKVQKIRNPYQTTRNISAPVQSNLFLTQQHQAQGSLNNNSNTPAFCNQTTRNNLSQSPALLSSSPQDSDTLANDAKSPTSVAAMMEQQQQGTQMQSDADSSFLVCKTLSTIHKFFAALLQNHSIDDLLDTVTAENVQAAEEAALKILGTMCERLELPIPTESLKAKYDTPRDHMQNRASLVLEEARHTLCQGLHELLVQKKKSAFCLDMIVAHKNYSFDDTTSDMMMDHNSPPADSSKKGERHVDAPTRFRRAKYKKCWFTPEEMRMLIPGVVLECSCNDENITLLGLVSSWNSQSTMAEKGLLDIIFFDPYLSLGNGTSWTFRPVGTSFITTARQFAAVMEYDPLVPFFDVIRGVQLPSERPMPPIPSSGDNRTESLTDPCVTPDLLQLPRLNESQRKASSVFLDSAEGSVTVVQGPPGTGKTTFCVGVICDYLMKPLPNGRRHRILCCAPTNKAIAHITKRFLASIRNNDEQLLKVVALGDDTKLGVGWDSQDFPLTLKSIHIYSWLESILEQYAGLKDTEEGDYCAKEKESRASLLRKRLHSSLGKLPSEIEKKMDILSNQLEKNVRGAELNSTIKDLKRMIGGLNQIKIRESVLNSANIVFATLSASRSTQALKMEKVDCLIVDEAAAATEPALYMPFHLQPSRMLAVGDPMQLPAIVNSNLAERFGLNESFHQRLMHRLHCREILLLDTQYRMKVGIASFPSRAFYSGMLKNGENVRAHDYGAGATMLVNNSPYVVVQIVGEVKKSYLNGSSYNYREAEAVVDLLREMRSKCSGSLWESEDCIRVISFYKEQVSLIRSLLKKEGFQKVSVGTVDSTQGCEADIVIVSFVKGSGTAGFLKDDRRINVALTRARHQLICVGDVEGMQYLREYGSSTLRRMSSDASKRGVLVSYTGAS